jgi:hypothetical protein
MTESVSISSTLCLVAAACSRSAMDAACWRRGRARKADITHKEFRLSRNVPSHPVEGHNALPKRAVEWFFHVVLCLQSELRTLETIEIPAQRAVLLM